jgi:hypothetical protein
LTFRVISDSITIQQNKELGMSLASKPLQEDEPSE